MDVDITKDDINKLRTIFEIYKELFGNPNSIAKKRKIFYKPPVSIQQTNDIISVMATIPELKKDDNVKVVLNGNVLHLSGVKKVSGNDGFSFKPVPFTRVVLLPSHVKQNEITATYQKGILEIRLIKDKSILPKEVKVNFL